MNTFIIYFHSRKNLKDTSTWRKEPLPSDTNLDEIKMAATFVGCEGFAVVKGFGTSCSEIIHMEWI